MGMSQLINEASGLLAAFTAEKNKVTAAVAAALSAISMSRYYYVDAVLGNDDNSGTSAAPFKTIKKAVDTIPVGGSGSVELIPDQAHIIPYGKNIELINKRVAIVGKVDKAKPSITNESVYVPATNGVASSGFVLRNSVLLFSYIKLKTSDRPEGYPDVQSNGSGIIVRQDLTSGYVGVFVCDVELGQTSFLRLPNGGSDINFSAYSVVISTPGTGKFVDLDSGVPIKASFATMTLPAGVKLGDLIGNIVRDINGNPINILCNVPLPATV